MRTLLTQTFCLVCNKQMLNLRDNQIGDAGMIKFSEALATGALANCQELQLWGNQIGDPGMIKFSEALATGALPVCTTITLSGNPASKEAQQAVKDAIKNRK